MKTLITTLALAASLTFAQPGVAKEKSTAPADKQTAVVAHKNGNVDVLLGKADSRYIVQIVDQQGHTLASQSVFSQHKTSRIRFDMNQLPDGVYEVVIIDGTNRQVKDVTLQTREAVSFRTVSVG